MRPPSDEPTPFEDAALYDWEYRRRRDDVRFYRTLAAERGGPVLDLGCGTGRLLVPLVRDGHRVVGVESAPAMLARAARRLERLRPEARRRALLVRADLEHLPLGPSARFGFAVAAFHVVQHLPTAAALVGFFRRVRAALAPGGWLAFDVFAPDPAFLARSARRRWDATRFRHPASGQRLLYTTTHHMDRRRRTLTMTFHYQPLDRRGRPRGRERHVRLVHRQLAPREVAALLARAGLELIATWGGFDGRPLARDNSDSEQHVYLARRRHAKRRSFTNTKSPRNKARNARSPSVALGISLDRSAPPDTMRTSSQTFRRRAAEMAEKVAKLGVSREKDFMYYVKDGSVWKVPRKQPGVPKGRAEKVADGGFDMDTNYIYFLDRDGDVARAKRAIGGQKRKKGARRARRSAKRAVRKVAKKKGGKPKKKAVKKKAGKKKGKR
jgi:SAM-dependent methyltransferase